VQLDLFLLQLALKLVVVHLLQPLELNQLRFALNSGALNFMHPLRDLGFLFFPEL
jgi:hypothetical protein